MDVQRKGLSVVFNKHNSPVYFKPGTHSETGPTWGQFTLTDTEQCGLYRSMDQHRMDNSTGQDSASMHSPLNTSRFMYKPENKMV